jgi:hypothetical protein
MELNADFSKRAVVHGAQTGWVASPMKGVDRRMLDRIGDEVARATSIVRYAPGSHFSSHVHTGGEEFLVIDGVFSDEHGDFPAGSYIRNPPESSHTPGSEPGCTILVKLWQFDLADRTHVRIDTNKMRAVPAAARPGVLIMPLFHDGRRMCVSKSGKPAPRSTWMRRVDLKCLCSTERSWKTARLSSLSHGCDCPAMIGCRPRQAARDARYGSRRII